MVIGSSIAIGASVGAGGRNRPEDVRAVQRRLNELAPLPRQRLAVSGQMDLATVNRILEFQVQLLLMPRPTGVIRPMDDAMRALNDPESARYWSAGAARGRYVPELTHENVSAALTAIHHGMRGNPEGSMLVREIFSYRETLDALSGWLSSASGVEYATEFCAVVMDLHRMDYDAARIGTILVSAVRNADEMDQLMELARESPTLLGRAGQTLSPANGPLNILSLLLSAYKVAAFLREGTGGIAPALGEIYATAMGMAVPWAGAVDGVQGLVGLIDPMLASSGTARTVFGLLNAINPVGAGRTAVDAIASVITAAVRCQTEGHCSYDDLDGFVRRARGTPMRVFVEWGEELGNTMASEWGRAFSRRFLR